MAVNILFLEDEKSSDSQASVLLFGAKFVEYTTVNGLEAVSKALYSETYSHVVCNLKLDQKSFSYLKSVLPNIPVLILCKLDEDLDLTGVHFSVCRRALTYESLFEFIAKKNIVSEITLAKYAMGDLVFMDQLKRLIIKEFEDSLLEIPAYLTANNFGAVKRNMHQLIGKFAMLEMEETHQLSKKIDSHILNDTVAQIVHVHQVLFDLEIALTQLRCSA